MNTISLLFIAIILVCVNGFLNKFTFKQKFIQSKTKTILNSTCMDENNDSIIQKKFSETKIISTNPPLYTILWYDCEDCKMLMDDMKKMHINFEFIDIQYNLILNPKIFIKLKKSGPTFLLNEEYFACSLFEMYEKLFISNNLLK